MSDLNHMSIEDLMKFAEEGVLPDEVGEENKSFAEVEKAEQVEEVDNDVNALSPEDLLALADGKAVPAEDSAMADVEEGEASEAELMAMLENTVAEDELDGTADEINTEVAQKIEKIKLRQLANKIDSMAPPKLFPPRKDEIYYFLTSMCGQTAKQSIDDAQDKCRFIGQALESLQSFMISEANLAPEEQDVLMALFEGFSKETVDEADTRKRVFEQYRMGWRQTMNLLKRDVRNLKTFARERYKPIWILIKFYESLSRAYGLCRAQDDFKAYEAELNTSISQEDKREIITLFEDILEISPFYGLKKLNFIDRKGAYQEVAKLNLDVILMTLRAKKY